MSDNAAPHVPDVESTVSTTDASSAAETQESPVSTPETGAQASSGPEPEPESDKDTILYYKNEFWGTTGDETVGPYKGFEVLSRRAADAKSMMTVFADVIASRCEIEKTYGHALVRLADHATKNNKDRHGTMFSAFEGTIQGMKTTGQQHVDLGTQISKVLGAHFKDFNSDQKSQRKQQVKHITNLHAQREKAYANLSKTKAAYNVKCQERETLEEQYKRAKDAGAQTPEETKVLDKLRDKLYKARTHAERAEFQYKQAVSTSEGIRLEWEKEFETVASSLQDIEEQRIRNVRQDFWVLANLQSICAVADDNAAEQVRETVTHVDHEVDIQNYIKENRTGSVRPAAIGYIPYQYKESVLKSMSIATSATNASYSGAYGPPSRSGSATKSSITEENESPVYEEQDAGGKSAGATETYVVIYDYKAQGPEELDLNEGDEVIVYDSSEDPWYKGSIGGKDGMVYKEYLEKKN
eukprot:CFRG3570T1